MTEQRDDRGWFEPIEGLPADTVGVIAHGVIDREDYERDLIPRVEKALAREGKVNLLYAFAPDFQGFTAGAAWEDARLGLTHLGDFARIAILADQEWIRLAVKLAAPLVPGEVRLFHADELEAARQWLARPPEPEAEPGAAVERSIPPLEDKLPPLE